MTIELVLFISLVGIGFNIISLWAITKIRNDQLKITRRIWERLNYLEAAISFHGLIPMPWEVEKIEEIVEEIKAFKQEGNVVYLQREE
jgi:hypothetical protein